MNEAAIERYLVKRVKELGGEVRKVQWIGRKGAPDRLVMLPQFGRVGRYCNITTMWVELKAPGLAWRFPTGPHERAQHREHVRMRGLRQCVLVLDSYESIDEVLR